MKRYTRVIRMLCSSLSIKQMTTPVYLHHESFVKGILGNLCELINSPTKGSVIRRSVFKKQNCTNCLTSHGRDCQQAYSTSLHTTKSWTNKPAKFIEAEIQLYLDEEEEKPENTLQQHEKRSISIQLIVRG